MALTESLLSLILTTALLLGSPGPAPIALAASGATFGMRRSLPFLIGILTGLSVAMIGAAFGLAALFSAFPQIRIVCQLAAAGYIAFIAFKIATASLVESAQQQQAPSFTDGFIFNLLNPKAYAAFLAIFAQFLLPIDHQISAYLITAFVCLLVAALVDTIWLAFGGVLKPMFRRPLQARILRVVFALGMVIAVTWTFF